MEQDGTWGDHVILCAAANRFETCIRVISSLFHSNDVIITPHCAVDESKPLVLGHIHEVHYVSLQPVQGTLELSQNFVFHISCFIAASHLNNQTEFMHYIVLPCHLITGF